ncbi:uncharacterized protein LOC131542354 isoform X2 [Onychostoma macrolepis]|uniref:uncharacterized protein LOC131542354 isoform X2 n=1 Tax=Onychostoma macrolepis TaxID=369639 RepID=UPI00272D5388|nr:uncharacterized protein LOC131542354 isoform X2 [Onychostoma macrolepis]
MRTVRGSSLWLSVEKDAAEMRDALLTPVRRFPWATNVTLYGCLFAAGDFVHQRFSRKERVDWTHTRNVAVVAFGFHGNFNFFWMRFLERRFPGNALRAVLRKLLLDQTLAAPLAISAFYTGELRCELHGGQRGDAAGLEGEVPQHVQDGPDVLAGHAVPELRSGSSADPHRLHRLLRLHLGHVPLLLAAERRRHHHGGSGLGSGRRAQTTGTDLGNGQS